MTRARDWTVIGPSDKERAAARGPRGPQGLREGAEAENRVGDRTGGAEHEPRKAKAVPSGRAARGKGNRRSRTDKSGRAAYGALDLGTNNCRLLVARPSRRGFVVIDAFSRIIRLGEGLTQSGQLSEPAMARTIDALKVCAEKLDRRAVKRSRIIATQACRLADNSDDFIERVKRETGLDLEIVSHETEAQLAVSGCASLLDRCCDRALVFDIGGGSSELIWLDLTPLKGRRRSVYDQSDARNSIVAWTSLPLGVVTLAERHGGKVVTQAIFEAMVDDVIGLLDDFEKAQPHRDHIANGNVHLLGTSGTVTTVAGVHLDLPAYDRNRVDGCWLRADDVRQVAGELIAMSYDDRVAQPCIGAERADLVLAGCAILEAVLRMWPCDRLRVADRGLREGILATLMAQDGHVGRRRPGVRRAGAARQQHDAK
jgi:exopolyphosphatase/guanosine-5'-triphosphate,3'-diphosphate pyrophosphatase